MSTLVFAFLLLFFLTIISPSKSDEPVLKMVQAVFRHGDRSPLNLYPKDIYTMAMWPNGAMELTNKGKAQAYDFGKFLRKRYNSLIGPSYGRTDIFVRSSDIDRTLMTAELVLAGLFPPSGKDIWNANINWQPVPVHTMPWFLDNAYNPLFTCPRFVVLVSSERIMKRHQNGELYKYLSKETGLNIRNAFDVHQLYDTLKAEKNLNLTLPEWTKSVYPEPMQTIATDLLRDASSTLKLKRLACGGVYKDILLFLKARQLDQNHVPRTILFSAHDFTVICLLNVLNLFNDLPVPFLGSLIFELYHNPPPTPPSGAGGNATAEHVRAGQHSPISSSMISNMILTAPTRLLVANEQDWRVKILYRNSTTDHPLVLNHPLCPTEVLCPMKKFEEYLIRYIPVDLKAECLMPTLLPTLSFK